MTAESEFTIGSVTYRAARMDAFRQWHVIRRLGTVAGALGAAVETVKRDSPDAALTDLGIDRIEPVLAALAKMTDSDMDYVTGACLATVTRKVEGDRGWAPIYSNGRLMYEDIDMPTMLMIVWRILEGSFSSFFALGSLGSMPAGAPPAGSR